ncbi:MAG: class I SAM-dependent methyltransferase [Bacteroidales bacterium]|jgi:SAM-dependent methyltransferase|nr:class I SAM-dependent methyltransferase [Bacteroidales bacterium]
MKFNYDKESKVKYVHTEEAHNTKAASIVVPLVNKLIFEGMPPPKVVDFGCGLGTWLKVFKDYGTSEVLGLDGKWVDKKLLLKYICEEEFCNVDMEQPIKIDTTYDLVVSLEVAEHISKASADIFVQSLVNAGKVILFSAAIPGQGGFNHVNEQWPEYWIEKFGKHGYIFHDIIRGRIWDNPNVDRHYRQNIFIVAHASIKISAEYVAIYSVVHPDYLIQAHNRLNGEIGIIPGLKLFLKGIAWKFKKHVFKQKSRFKPWHN